MILRFPTALLGAAALGFTTLTFAAADSPSSLAPDTPVSQILNLASTALTSGNSADALSYYDLAISRDPQNYLTLFKRGATYLSLGRSPQALADFDKVLAIKPDFEGALLQRAKIRSRHANWSGARQDYLAAGRTPEREEIVRLDEAEGAATLARDAEKAQEWEQCVSNAGIALMTAGAAMDLRQLRARCRFERGEIPEAVQDLQHVLLLNPNDQEVALQISAMNYYSSGDSEKGIKAMSSCLRGDPDSKRCTTLFKREKKVDKELKKVRQAIEKRTFSQVVKMLVPGTNAEEEPGLLETVQVDFKEFVEAGYIHAKAPQGLYTTLLEMTCDSFIEMNNHKRGAPYCTTLLTLNPTSLPALLHKAQTQLDAEDYEGSVRTLNSAKDTHGTSNPHLSSLLQKAQTELKRSKTKDYYRVLSIPRDSSARDIRKAYRKLSQLNHPDKAKSAAERPELEKKMAAINEAYEVLSDPELKERFDRGDDPNDPEAQMRGRGGNPFQGQGHPFQQFFGGGGGGFPGGGFPGGGGQQFQFKFGG